MTDWRKGFTLIELMVVIAIIGIMGATALPRFAGVTDEAKIAGVQSNLVNIRTMLEMYQVKNGEMPDLEMDVESGHLGGAEEYYAKDMLPRTPAYKGFHKYGSGQKMFFVEDTNKVCEGLDFDPSGFLGDGKGGWSYIRATKEQLVDPNLGRYYRKFDGQIRANLTHGTYGTELSWKSF